MRTAGIIGGIGPESTIDYYRRLISVYKERDPEGNYPQLLINSVNLNVVVACVEENRIDDLAGYLLGELQKLADAGADFAVLSSNTTHLAFDQLQRTSPLPMISIIEVTCQKAISLGFTRLGLFGTRFIMQGEFYHEVWSRNGIELVVPTEAEQDYIHEKYMDELVDGIIRDETRQQLISIAQRLKEAENIQGLILGGTELPLILRQADLPGIPVLDTSGIHVEAIVDALFEGELR